MHPARRDAPGHAARHLRDARRRPRSARPAPTDNKSGAVSPSDVCGEGGVLPAEEDNAPTTGRPRRLRRPNSGSGVLPAEETNSGTQPTRQEAAAAQTSQLPFTGFAAIPVLLGGLALLSGGLVLRRRTRGE